MKRRQVARQIPIHDGPDIRARADGYYWIDETRREVGPFASVAAALEDMRDNRDESLASDEELREVEAQIGMADWIDPDTGEPGEEERPRTEEH